ncbi:copper homeostasis protein CutC [Oceanobacillus sp. J11TS1]|uniref:copper homeostasis protein CutC n=1 Tax=Oceanobacillus sp. J11TS1 TaxID=2807191 RepID=UPI001B0ECB50|nr:copper homeostasis protein CutC [Oceanobacillus sp. J11TS1]GIO22198.1 copper homeostasis protein CutC [Oceanobacillus sp. J11TS1]
MIECIVQNAPDARDAERLGVTRLELLSAIELGGLTPSYGTVHHVINSVQIPVQVMIRPHPYGFMYRAEDKMTMKKDISLFYEMGHKRFVIGALTENKTIDIDFLADLFRDFPDLDVTFHRAFDEVRDQVEAYQALIPYRENIKRILTSGGAANCDQGKDALHTLVQMQYRLQGPSILPGSGLHVDNIKKLHTVIQAEEYHFGSGVRFNQTFDEGMDRDKIEVIRRILD